MTRKITTTIYGFIALYAVFIGIQFFQLQFRDGMDVRNITIFLTFFVVFFTLIIMLHELIKGDNLIRMFFVFISILNLNYFIIAFFTKMIPTAVGGWAGQVFKVNLLFFTRELSLATLIEYNLFFRLPMYFNIGGILILITLILVRRN